jgi:hypothetical protein
MQKAVTRREYLRMTAAGLGLTAWRLQPLEALTAMTSDQLTRARRVLKTIILEHAKAKDNPWLLIHGIRAMGRAFSIGDGSALEYLCSHYLRETSVNGKAYLYMPIDDEGHPNAFLSEAVLDAGVPADYPFLWHGRRYTITDVLAGARALFAFDPASFDRDALAWTLVVFAHTTPPKQNRWINAYGKPIGFSNVVEFGITTLEEATARLRSAIHQPPVALQDGIHEFACGGTHLIYGLSTCLRFGYGQRSMAERMRAQYDLLVWRLEADSRLIDGYYREVATEYPQDVARIYALDAKLKFLGHAFEVINHARLFRLFSPTADQEDAIARAQRELVDVIEAIGYEGIRRHLGDKKLVNLLLGDACHAYHGLTMIRGVNQA